MLHGGSHHTSGPRQRRWWKPSQELPQTAEVVEAITRVAPDSREGGGSHQKSVLSSLVLQRIGTFINYCMCNNTVMHNC